MIAAMGLALIAAWGENRLWFVDLELRGACAEVRLDCGADGETRVAGPFSSAEDRRLRVPVPVRSPLGVAGLTSLPLPSVEVSPPDAGARVRVLGWSAEQPAERLARDSGDLLARPRPPVSTLQARAAAPELLLVLAAGCFLLGLRRHLVPFLALALVAGLCALELARRRTSEAPVARVLEWDFEQGTALAVLAAQDELSLPREWLEVTPAGRRLELRVEGAGVGRVLASGARLAALERAPAPKLTPRLDESLADAWTRGARGDWRAHGPLALGDSLDDSLGEGSAGGSPPGWLASALPQGRGVLLARTASGLWWRCVGFPRE